MHRLYFYLAGLISILALPVAALAETPAIPATADTQIRSFAPAANDAGFYVALPAVDSSELIELVSAYQASLTHRQQEIRRYLEDNQLDGKDMLIAVIMPGGLLYAAVRKGNLEQAQAELARLAADMDELSRDLVVMQAVAGELTVAQVQ